jgi:proteasome alpha subunit
VTTSFYVSPEQIMKDRAEYARKGISRGRSVAVIFYDKGILFVGENPSRALHKVSEIYDRIAFAAAGRYNEYETLRVAGVRHADMRGYVYDRRDVSGRALANTYAQALGTMFSENAGKPYEVELAVAEVGESPAEDQAYRITFDGQVTDIRGFQVMGGAAEAVSTVLESSYTEGANLEEALRTAVDALGRDGSGDARVLTPNQLEVAVLDRTRPQVRKFRRIVGPALGRLLGQDDTPSEPAPESESRPESAPAAVQAEGDVLDAIDDVLDDDSDGHQA